MVARPHVRRPPEHSVCRVTRDTTPGPNQQSATGPRHCNLEEQMSTLSDLTGSPLSRRRFIQGTSLAGVAAFLAACGTKPAATVVPTDAASVAPTVAPTPTGPAPTAGAVLNWANWSYYIDYDADTKTYPTLEAFKAKYGTTVNYQEIIEGNDDFYGIISKPLEASQDTGWDIIVLTDWMAARIIRKGWAEQFDLASMPNFSANLIDAYRKQDWDPGTDHHAPWQGGMTGIGYDSAVAGAITSMKSLFTDDPRWHQKVEFLSEMRDAIGLTMLLNGDDPAAPTRAACDKAIAKMKEAQAAKITRDVKGQSYTEDLKSGDAVLSMAWSGDMVQALIDKPTLKFAWPDEGAMIWTDNCMIPKGAKNKFTAELMIDYCYDPGHAAQIEAYVNYLCPVKGADQAMLAIDPNIANNPLIFPTAEIQAKLHRFGALTEEDEQYFNDQFATILGVG